MSLAVANAAPLKPEIRLAQAISEFEASLNPGQKARFRSYRSGPAPDLSEVCRLTAEIDNNRAQRRFSGQSVGPRLTNILQSLQEFSSVVDVIIGASQNLTAGALWGVIKLALQLAIGAASFFDKLSSLFMEIGLQCPRFQHFGTFFPKSQKLQKSLCEYYITICKLCQHAVTTLSKSGLLQTPLNAFRPFDSQFGPFKENLQKWANTIRDEAWILSEQAEQDERVENSKSRALFAKVSSSTSMELREEKARRKKRAKAKLLDALSTFDYQKFWIATKKKGSSFWITETPEYKNWKDEAQSSALWCKGPLGSGKTVLAASVVQDIMISSSTASVGYFFCDFLESKSLESRNICGSLARQLIEQLTHDLPEKYIQPASTVWTVDAVLAMLKEVLVFAPARQHYVLVDGLEECPQVEIEKCVHFLDQMLSSKQTFKIFLTSRPDALQDLSKSAMKSLEVISLANHCIERNLEIEEYIDDELRERLEKERFKLSHEPAIVLKIREKLLNAAEGMFLWVSLQLDRLCEDKLDEDGMLEFLEHLPRTLGETYDRILEKLAKLYKDTPEFSRTIYLLLMASRRPLTVQELGDAISIEIGETHWNPKKQINDMNKVLQRCGSLVIVNEEDSTVRFTHQTVKQHLLSDSSFTHLGLIAAESFMSDTCITYLNSERFQTALAKPRQALAVSSVLQSSVSADNSMNRMALKLLKSRKAHDFDVASQLERISVSRQHGQGSHEAFLDYAQSYWLEHSRLMTDSKQKLYPLWSSLVAGRASTVVLPWIPATDDLLSTEIVKWTLENNHTALLCLLLAEVARSRVPNESFKRGFHLNVDLIAKKVDLRVQFNDKDSPVLNSMLLPPYALEDMIIVGVRLRLPELLLAAHRRLPNAFRDQDFVNRSIVASILDWDTGIARQLFGYISHHKLKVVGHPGADMYTVEALEQIFGHVEPEGSPLLKASYANHAALVHLLLDHGIDAEDDEWVEMLKLATGRRNIEMLSKLLLTVEERGIGLSRYHHDLLVIACGQLGRAETVKVLLDHSKNQDDLEQELTFVGKCAAREGDADLLDTALVKIGQYEQMSSKAFIAAAMREACCNPRESKSNRLMVDLLIKKGADVTGHDPSGQPLIHAAMEAGSVWNVERLVEAGANINAVWHQGTVLDVAENSRKLDHTTAKALQDMGAKTYSRLEHERALEKSKESFFRAKKP